MINWNNVKKWQQRIKKNKEKLLKEPEFNKREKLKLKIQIDELKVKIEKLN